VQTVQAPPSSWHLNVEPGSPSNVNVVSGVPLVAAGSAGTAGASGAVASTVSAIVDSVELPTRSTTETLTVRAPSASGAGSGSENVPSLATTPVATTTPSTLIVTVEPGSPVPVTVGWLLAVSPESGPVTVSSAVRSTVHVSAAGVGSTRPP
jgi:hypothetical protein